MVQQYKKDAVEKLKDIFSEGKHFVFTEYSGLTVEQMTNLRRKLRENGAIFKVVKNRLARIAYKEINLSFKDEWFTGPLALIICQKEDYVLPIKTAYDFSKENKNLKLKFAYLENKVYELDKIKEIATLPTREELIARLLGLMNSPITRFVFGLKSIITKLVLTLKAIENKKSETN